MGRDVTSRAPFILALVLVGVGRRCRVFHTSLIVLKKSLVVRQKEKKRKICPPFISALVWRW